GHRLAVGGGDRADRRGGRGRRAGGVAGGDRDPQVRVLVGIDRRVAAAGRAADVAERAALLLRLLPLVGEAGRAAVPAAVRRRQHLPDLRRPANRRRSGIHRGASGAWECVGDGEFGGGFAAVAGGDLEVVVVAGGAAGEAEAEGGLAGGRDLAGGLEGEGGGRVGGEGGERGAGAVAGAGVECPVGGVDRPVAVVVPGADQAAPVAVGLLEDVDGQGGAADLGVVGQVGGVDPDQAVEDLVVAEGVALADGEVGAGGVRGGGSGRRPAAGERRFDSEVAVVAAYRHREGDGHRLAVGGGDRADRRGGRGRRAGGVAGGDRDPQVRVLVGIDRRVAAAGRAADVAERAALLLRLLPLVGEAGRAAVPAAVRRRQHLPDLRRPANRRRSGIHRGASGAWECVGDGEFGGGFAAVAGGDLEVVVVAGGAAGEAEAEGGLAGGRDLAGGLEGEGGGRVGGEGGERGAGAVAGAGVECPVGGVDRPVAVVVPGADQAAPVAVGLLEDVDGQGGAADLGVVGQVGGVDPDQAVEDLVVAEGVALADGEVGAGGVRGGGSGRRPAAGERRFDSEVAVVAAYRHREGDGHRLAVGGGDRADRRGGRGRRAGGVAGGDRDPQVRVLVGIDRGEAAAGRAADVAERAALLLRLLPLVGEAGRAAVPAAVRRRQHLPDLRRPANRRRSGIHRGASGAWECVGDGEFGGGFAAVAGGDLEVVVVAGGAAGEAGAEGGLAGGRDLAGGLEGEGGGRVGGEGGERGAGEGAGAGVECPVGGVDRPVAGAVPGADQAAPVAVGLLEDVDGQGGAADLGVVGQVGGVDPDQAVEDLVVAEGV